MFKTGDKVSVARKQGVWIVKDADERHNNAVMLVHPLEASGFVLMAVRSDDCQKVGA
ncbi:hypothetical protein UFOVP582_20 [uncultured Caudovirales phage]|uniref:Uncharacterized protein n=1 Tax=uncultured Caudovirales phage TaxID=2100421 RepID=A0A6J7XCN2_9CAUD|nr:hypothetical protein UFOVP582_20 [uncultured Caudovirales phage]CAB4184098.1 hypothetical protein UFOVP1099_34 [uncultured Caudovirales phage]CAB4214475.1 hypothetical protein UFOVP1460_39 [uncultured Caudovirales phage]CAB5228827.1 hypothetical protein UFOVP1548_42 [uncultured Caudovirales phage]